MSTDEPHARQPAAGPKLPPYGPSITLAQAKQVADTALAPARENGWTMVIAIVDPGGYLVYLEKMDETQVGSVAIADTKARSAAIFKRSTKMFQDRLASGGAGLLVLRLQDAIPVEGGLPIIVDGKLIGALGVSGGSSAEDEVCAEAGASALP
ncbi:GlcG/HbpS family heme-binding protein [Candidatus Rariloculus sp.]|uniref:GlcG/HbpS family heme-binding protein n=1 Tax=Candidatus Rariloculus sp. TaxID=3101265 RepID=UPI003D098154